MELERQLQDALTPTRPGPQVRAAVLFQLAQRRGRRLPSKWVLTTLTLALGAAAAMLATRLAEPTASALLERPDTGAPAGLTEVSEVTASLDEVPTPAAVEPAANEPLPVAADATPFSVQILPLQTEGLDAAHSAAAKAAYTAFVNGLRSVPGLTLVPPATAGAPITPDYRIKLVAKSIDTPTTDGGDFYIVMDAQRLGPGDQMISGLMISKTGDSRPACASSPSLELLMDRTSCADAAGVAGSLLVTLRQNALPPDAQLQRRLQARLINSATPPEERLWALSDLSTFGKSSGAVARDEFAPGLRDPAVLRAAIQLAAASPDPATRAQVWYVFRGSGDPDLLMPLLEALRADPDDDTRIQALATLAADFAADQRVRNALENTARADLDPLVRALAQRALGAADGWTEYVMESLKDAERSPVKRVEAFFHAYGVPSSRTYGSFSADGRILRQLDDAGMRALTEVLPRAAAESKRYAHASLTLVSQLTQMEHPAIDDMLLDGLTSGATWIDRRMVIEGLGGRTGDPRVMAAFQKIAADDPDPQLRTLAAAALSGSAPPSQGSAVAGGGGDASPRPPRLGVMTNYLNATDGVPPELVGKLAVVDFGPGSVAEKAGIKEADVLLELDGKSIASGEQLIEVLNGLQRNVDVEVVVFRDGQTLRLTARF